MIKEFSIPIPNELYIHNYSENKTMNLTYSGPETLYVQVSKTGTVLNFNEEPPAELDNTDSFSYFVELNCNTHPAVGYWMTTKNDPYEMVFEDEINYDGSIYKKLSNPTIHNYYDLIHNRGSSIIYNNGLNSGPWELKLIEKDTKTPQEEEALKNLSYVQTKLKNIELEEPYLTTYTNFLSNTESFLALMGNVHPWKFITINETAPKIPLSLIKLIKELPEIQ